MSRFWWKDGRLAWPPVLAFCISGVALIVGDYVWRVSSVSGKVIAAVCGAVVLGSIVAAIFNASSRSRKS